MAPLQEAQDDALLAEQLQPMLKPALEALLRSCRTSALRLYWHAVRRSHLERLAVVLKAYHKVESARDRVAELAERVRPLLNAAQSLALGFRLPHQ